MVINNTRRGHRIIPKPVTEESKIKEVTESLKEAEVDKKAESFYSESPKENLVVKPVPEDKPVSEDKPVQSKKETNKKKKYKLEELMAED